MAHIVIDRCKENTSTTGTGNLTLTGAAIGFASVASKLTSNGDTSWFCAEAGSQWEIFLGTRVSATELARTTLLSSSTGSTINFSTPPVVFSTVPGEKISTIGPAFKADRITTDQTVTSGAWTKVQLNGETFDIGGCFDSATNYRWTPNVAGYYQMSMSVDLSAASAGSGALSSIYKNGAVVLYGCYTPLSGGVEAVSTGGGLIYMNGTTDYVELWGLVSGTTTKIKFGPATYMTGYLARPE